MYAQLLCNENIVHIRVCASVLLSKSNYINLQNSIDVKGTSLLWMGHVTKMVSFYTFIHSNVEVQKQKCRRWLSIIILPELNPSTLQHSEEKPSGAFNNIIFYEVEFSERSISFLKQWCSRTFTQAYLGILKTNMYKKINSSSSSFFLWRLITFTISEHVTWHKISPLKKHISNIY